MSIKKRLAAFGCSVGLAVASLAFFAGPAEAASITICNSGTSVNWIKAYNNSVRKEYFIGPDSCTAVDNAGGNARVNVDPEHRGVDVQSWDKKNAPLGSGTYPGCYNNEDSASNPYNSGTTSYRTFPYTNCVGW